LGLRVLADVFEVFLYFLLFDGVVQQFLVVQFLPGFGLTMMPVDFSLEVRSLVCHFSHPSNVSLP
jgi:hypothetical protein